MSGEPYRGLPRNGLRLVGALACAVLLAGCGTPQERVRTVRVDVPGVPVECPRLVLPPRPDPILDTIPSTASDDTKARATAADLIAYKGYAEQLEKVITGRAPGDIASEALR